MRELMVEMGRERQCEREAVCERGSERENQRISMSTSLEALSSFDLIIITSTCDNVRERGSVRETSTDR